MDADHAGRSQSASLSFLKQWLITSRLTVLLSSSWYLLLLLSHSSSWVPTLSLTGWVRDPLTLEPFSRDPRYIAQKAEKYLQSTGIGETSYWGPEADMLGRERSDAEGKLENPLACAFFVSVWGKRCIMPRSV